MYGGRSFGFKTGDNQRSSARPRASRLVGRALGSVTLSNRIRAPVKLCSIGLGPRSKWKEHAFLRSAEFQFESTEVTALVKPISNFARCPHASPIAKQRSERPSHRMHACPKACRSP